MKGEHSTTDTYLVSNCQLISNETKIKERNLKLISLHRPIRIGIIIQKIFIGFTT